MEQIYFGERIAAYRKERGLTQEGLAQKLGVTNQAVSKWEADQCCPDIMLLPALADTFQISMDELFGRRAPTAEKEAEREPERVIADLPWPDDNDLRAVCYVGHRLVDYGASSDRRISLGGLVNVHIGTGNPMQLHFSGAVDNIHAEGDVICTDTAIAGSVEAGDSVTCGDVGGDVEAGDSVTCGSVSGDVAAGDSIRCGDAGGNAEAGDSIRCGNIGGDADAGDSIYCGEVGGRVGTDE